MLGNLVIDKIPCTMAKNVQVCYALPWKSEHDQKYQSSPTFMALFVHRLTTEALNIGEPLLVEASQLDFFDFGHHMGEADLRYLITASRTG